MATQDADVGYEVAGAVATLTLRRPALTTAAKEQLLGAVTRAAEDDDVRAVVLTGSGRAFCAGQDLGEHAEALERDPGTAFETIGRHYNPVISALTGAPKPVVAAINGTCAGAGISLALACDVRLAAAGARFATAFTAIGLTFDSGLSATLARAVGAARASELILLGEPFTAEQALDWGLVGRVVPPDELPAAAAAVAAKLAAGPTRAYAAAKRALAEAWGAPLPAVLEAERAAQEALGRTADHQGAVRAFLAKQPPAFTGRD
ncbi:MAG TPA: enoyl-CoA hydratase-related protein [Acidimicrobiales bacterium]|nr:enoyl-CoA hydratase-related protein [Acidimicrobiales bacterium]